MYLPPYERQSDPIVSASCFEPSPWRRCWYHLTASAFRFQQKSTHDERRCDVIDKALRCYSRLIDFIDGGRPSGVICRARTPRLARMMPC